MRFTSIEVCTVVLYSINWSVTEELFLPTYDKGAAGAVLLMRLMSTLTLITFMISYLKKIDLKGICSTINSPQTIPQSGEPLAGYCSNNDGNDNTSSSKNSNNDSNGSNGNNNNKMLFWMSMLYGWNFSGLRVWTDFMTHCSGCYLCSCFIVFVQGSLVCFYFLIDNDVSVESALS